LLGSGFGYCLSAVPPLSALIAVVCTFHIYAWISLIVSENTRFLIRSGVLPDDIFWDHIEALI